MATLLCKLFVALLCIPATLCFSVPRPVLATFNVIHGSRVSALKAPFQGSVVDSLKQPSVVFSLDRPVYQPPPRSLVYLEAIYRDVGLTLGVAGAALASVAGTKFLIKAIASKTPRKRQLSATTGTGSSRNAATTSSRRLVPFALRSAVARVQHIMYTTGKKFSGALVGEGTPLDISTWNPGTLAAATQLPGGYVRYRFSIESSRAFLPLDVGQEVTLSLVDSKDRVLKDNFFPFSKIGANGYFEVISPTIDTAVASASSLTAEEKFSRALSELRIGDEVAFRGGKHRLRGFKPWLHSEAGRNRSDCNGPISRISVVAAGLGILPTIPILSYVFDGIASATGAGDSVVSILPPLKSHGLKADMLWLNEDESDFVGSDTISNFEYRYGNRFIVNKLLEPDLYRPDLGKSEELRSYLSPYSPGSVALICAPEHLIEQFRFIYRELGYPVENILSIMSAN